MPPHPRLREQIKQGEIPVPLFLADPALARHLGLNYSPEGPRQLTGSINALAVLVDFDDKVQTVTASFFDTLIFASPVVGRGSVHDYYDEVSYGQVDIVTVDLPSSLGWERAPQSYSYYVGGAYCTDAPYPNNCRKLAEDIVDAVDEVVNFADYDNDGDLYAEPIMLIHAGAGAEFTGSKNDVWSHSWSLGVARHYDGVWINDYVIMPEYWLAASAGSSDMTIGVFVHEMGHGFWNLPDVYDRDDTSSGVGDWSLMSSGSWNGPDRGGWGTDGSSPAWPDAWCRTQMGFVTATDVSSNLVGQSIPRAYNNAPPIQTVFKLRSAALGAQEFFLVENRQRVLGSYDQYLPGQGLLIWHVDEAMNTYNRQNDYECTLDPHCDCNDSYHFLLALGQADGARQLEYGTNGGDAGDPFPGSTDKRAWTMATQPGSSSWYECADTCIGVTNISDSRATMTADLQVTCGPPPTYDNFAYLPLIRKNDSPAGPGGEIGNGDFEAGPTVWDEYSSHGWDLIINSGFPTGKAPHSGNWAVWLGGDYDDASYIQQQVTVPADRPYLHYWHWIDSVDFCEYDSASVRINDLPVAVYDLCLIENTGGWVEYVVDLRSYIGQSVSLQLRVETDISFNSNLFVDDISFQASSLSSRSSPATVEAKVAKPRSAVRTPTDPE